MTDSGESARSVFTSSRLYKLADRYIDERLVVATSLLLFATPAALTVLNTKYPIPQTLHSASALLILLVPLSYGWITRSDDEAPRTNIRADEQRENAEQATRASESELIGLNYEMISEQAMYRDQLLIRANYFSIAVVGVLVNAFLRSEQVHRPAIAMVGAASGFAFWLATKSYKGTRDALNDELGRLEKTHHDLDVIQTYDTRNRSPIEKRSLSSYFVGFQIATTILWLLVYLGYVLALNVLNVLG